MPREKSIAILFAKVRSADRRLADWMRANHDDLLAELGSRRIVWRPLMQVITELGLLDEHGKQPTRDTAFRTWRRVRDDVAASRTERRDKHAALGLDEIAPGVRALADHSDRSEEGVLPRVRQQDLHLHIRFARPLTEMPTAANEKPDGPAVATNPLEKAIPEPGEDASEQIRRVLDAIGAARTPMPKIIR